MYPVATKVLAHENMTIEVEFDNGVRKLFDVNQMVETHPYFAKLKDETLFKNVHVDFGGFGLVWNDEIDLASSAVWLRGKTVA